MADVKELRCVICDCRFAIDEVSYTCPEHGEVATLDILYDYPAMRAQLDRDAISASGTVQIAGAIEPLMPISLRKARRPHWPSAGRRYTRLRG